jgi:hypothetical protein
MPPRIPRTAPSSKPATHNDDPLAALLRAVSRTATPRVRRWLAALANGERIQAESREARA